MVIDGTPYTLKGVRTVWNGGKLGDNIKELPIVIKATLSEKECREMADAIADDYVHLDEYKVETEVEEIYANVRYVFKYFREISGYPTSDWLMVVVYGDGSISSFGMRMLGSFSAVEKVVFNEEAAQAAIESKLGNIYGEKSTWAGYEVQDVTLIRLEDGSCAFLYTIENQFVDGIHHDSSLVQLVLKQA